MKRSCLLKNRVFGKKGRKIYIKAQNARKTFKTAEFAVVEMPFGVESEKIERCGSDVRRWLAFCEKMAGVLRSGGALRFDRAGRRQSRVDLRENQAVWKKLAGHVKLCRHLRKFSRKPHHARV
jgi:hypothetical protein